MADLLDTNRAATADQHRAHGWGRTVKERMQRKAASGIFPGCPPVGYVNDGVRGRRGIAVAPDGWLVSYAFELADRQDLSLRQLLDRMTTKGLRSRRGKSLGPSAFWHLLTNPFYTGWLRYDGQLIKGVHEPLVSKQRFARVQEKLAKRRRY
jgi:site-specific DNA recombinase